MKEVLMSEVIANVATAIREDLASGDVTGQLLSAETQVRAQIITREPMMLCGRAWANCAFHNLSTSIRVTWHKSDGDRLDAGDILCDIEGPAIAILTAERTALNFLQSLSATATSTASYVTSIEAYDTQLLDTRKTLPGLRYAQKYAVSCGGGQNHRHGLYDAFLIKENHIAACGGIAKAVEGARALKLDVLIEVEVESLSELSEALAAKADVIMLDNFSLNELLEAVAMRGNEKSKLEASGNVSRETIADIAATGVDYISVGAITKNIAAIDLSLRVLESY